MISVPVPHASVLNTIGQLPRIPKEAGLIPVQLKRKNEYKGYHRKELIDPHKILRFLDFLKKSGHPDYQFYSDLDEYKKRCEDQHTNGHNLIFSNPDDNKISSNEDTDSDDTEEEKENNYITNDPVRKHQFDHNKNSCMTNNYPEMFVDGNGEKVINSEHLSFAPAEGNWPTNLLNEKNWDIKSWPGLHPDGLYGLHHRDDRKSIFP
jgi:hypothetical protein